jgi:hypothetical protein
MIGDAPDRLLQYWNFGEAGSVTLRTDNGPPIGAAIHVYQGHVEAIVARKIPDRNAARWLACRLMEAVSIAEMQKIGALQ